MEYISLNNGVTMPILGYGVYQVTKEECERCVLDALKVGNSDCADFSLIVQIFQCMVSTVSI